MNHPFAAETKAEGLVFLEGGDVVTLRLKLTLI